MPLPNHNILEKIIDKKMSYETEDIIYSIKFYTSLLGTIKNNSGHENCSNEIYKTTSIINKLCKKINEPIFILFSNFFEYCYISSGKYFRCGNICQFSRMNDGYIFDINDRDTKPIYPLNIDIYKKMEIEDIFPYLKKYENWIEIYKEYYLKQKYEIFYEYGPKVFMIPYYKGTNKDNIFFFDEKVFKEYKKNEKKFV